MLVEIEKYPVEINKYKYKVLNSGYLVKKDMDKTKAMRLKRMVIQFNNLKSKFRADYGINYKTLGS